MDGTAQSVAQADVAYSDTLLYLVRHGRTSLNAAGELRGHLDVPLDDVGEHEAARLADLFARVPLAIVVTSPLRRARQTAERIADACSTGWRIDRRLIDRDYGDWAGHARISVEQRFGTLDAAPGVESVAALRARTIAAVNDSTAAHASQRIMVVAHDAVNRVVLSALVPALGAGAELRQPTGCWNRLRRFDRWTAEVIGADTNDGRAP